MKKPAPVTYEDLFFACSNTAVILLGILAAWWLL